MFKTPSTGGVALFVENEHVLFRIHTISLGFLLTLGNGPFMGIRFSLQQHAITNGPPPLPATVGRRTARLRKSGYQR